MGTARDLTAAAAAVGRYQAIYLILESLFTDEEQADMVRSLMRRYLPGMPVPDPDPDPDPEDDAADRDDGPTPPLTADSELVWHVVRVDGPRAGPSPRDAEPFAATMTADGPIVWWRYRA